jgi:hypothetical protein
MWSFNDLFELSVIFALIAAILFGIDIILGAINQKIFLIVASAASAGMMIGVMFYLAQGEFIFEFLHGSPQYFYWIRILDVLGHIGWLLLVLVATSIPIVYSNIAILRTTEFKAEQKIVRVASIKPSILQNQRVELKSELPK